METGAVFPKGTTAPSFFVPFFGKTAPERGICIASDRSGYFYAGTAGEVYSTIQSLKKMRAGLDGAIAGLELALDAFPGPGR